MVRAPYLNQSHRSNLISINKDEYIIASDKELCKYNISTNELHSFISYPKRFNKFECYGVSNIAYETKTDLYIYLIIIRFY